MKMLYLLAVLLLCPCARCQNYDTAKVPEYTVSLARRMGIHDAILKMAAGNRISADEFPAYYYRVAVKNIELRNLQYYSAARDIESMPGKTFEFYRLKTESDPANADYWAFRGMAAEAILPGHAAEHCYTKAIELDKNGGNYGYLYYRRGRLYNYLGMPGKAVEDLTRSLAEVSGNPLCHLERARAFCALDKYSECSSDLAKFFAYEKNTQPAKAESLGFLCEKLAYHGQKTEGCGDVSVVRTAYLETLGARVDDAMDGKSPSLRSALAVYETGGRADPIPYFAALKLLDGVPPSDAVWFLKGHIKYLLASVRMYTFSDAMADFEKVSAPPRLKAWALERQADIYGKYGDIPSALSRINRALVLQADSPQFHLARAGIEIAGSDLAAAVNDARLFFKLADSPELQETGSRSGVCRQLAENGFTVDGCQSADYFANIPPADDKWFAVPLDTLID